MQIAILFCPSLVTCSVIYLYKLLADGSVATM